MALAIILKNSARIQANPTVFKTAITINSRKSFTQLLNGSPKSSRILPKINLNGLTKRNMSADHSKLWPIEKAVTIALLGITPLAFITPNTVLDDLLAIATVVHFHWYFPPTRTNVVFFIAVSICGVEIISKFNKGLEACVVDYIRPIVVGPIIPKASLALLYLLSISTLGGLLYYNHHSIGIGNTVRRIWKIQK